MVFRRLGGYTYDNARHMAFGYTSDVALMVAPRLWLYGYAHYTEDGVRNETEYGAWDDNVTSDYCTRTCLRLSLGICSIATLRYDEFMKLSNPVSLLPLFAAWRFLLAVPIFPKGEETA